MRILKIKKKKVLPALAELGKVVPLDTDYYQSPPLKALSEHVNSQHPQAPDARLPQRQAVFAHEGSAYSKRDERRRQPPDTFCQSPHASRPLAVDALPQESHFTLYKAKVIDVSGHDTRGFIKLLTCSWQTTHV